MNLDAVAKTLAASAAAMLIAGCGGGGGDAAPVAGNVVLSGTAAVGAALADASVEVKCAQGSGSATTTTAGGYTVTVSGGKLPCIVKVSGTGNNGVAVTLHSVAEAGTASGSDVNATANVTPVTEMIVAQLMAALPADVFANFNPQQVTQAALDSAAEAIVAALKTAGIDLSAIDPLKDPLVPANGSTAGNAYDVLLDKLGETVGPETLPLVVNQIATAATTKSSEGLNTAIQAVSGGTLEGCPYAISGKYRTIEFRGETAVHTVDFKAMTLTTEGGSPEAITKSSTQACQFSVGETTIVVSPSGAGAFTSNSDGGYFFPVQSHGLEAIQGDWNFLESALNESNQGEHFFGNFGVKADGSVAVCEYDVMNGLANFKTCTPETETIKITAEADGSFTLDYDGEHGKVYGYRTPTGTMHLLGTNNPSADYSNTAFRSHFLLNRPVTLALPEVGTVAKYWDMTVMVFSDGAASITPLAAGEVKVTAVDAASNSFERTRTSDGRVDSFQVNQPVDGLRYRPASAGASSMFMFMMPGLGISPFIDNTAGHFFGAAIARN